MISRINEIQGYVTFEVTIEEKEAERIRKVADKALDYYNVPPSTRQLIGLAVLATGFGWIEEVEGSVEKKL